ncbi:Uncharacterised protein [Mycobacteroides abscessus subsp. massiliense]|nr:Uncharacterised protein [Mycobacteroides abscessus subsp. massiliense]
MKEWRVVPRTDKLGNQLWSLQYDVIYLFPEPKRYNLWREDRVFRNEGRALADLAYLQQHKEGH